MEIRLIPKECKKVKCSVCNRQQGACVRCAHLGCTTFFHPLCVERGGKGYLRTRLGERVAYCHQHIPEGVDRCEGYLVDGPEISRLRVSLDRSRVILDTLLRREKYKLRLCKLEGDSFSSTFLKAVDRAKGRKHENSLENLDLGDSGSEYGDEEYDDDQASGEEEEVVAPVDVAPVVTAVVEVPLKKGKDKSKDKDKDKEKAVMAVDEFQHCPIDFKSNRGEDVTVTSKNRELKISGAWTKLREVSLPKRVSVSVVGLPIHRRDIAVEGGRKAFLRILREKIDENLAISRSQNQIFPTQRESLEFAKKLGPSLIKHMKMSTADFSEEMGRMNVVAYPDFDRMLSKQQSKALKRKLKGQAAQTSMTASASRPLALYDAPLELDVSRRKAAPGTSFEEKDEEEDDDEEEEEDEEVEEMNGTTLDSDMDVDVDEFLASDFFMTDFESEKEIRKVFKAHKYSISYPPLPPSSTSASASASASAPSVPKRIRKDRVRAPRDRKKKIKEGNQSKDTNPPIVSSSLTSTSTAKTASSLQSASSSSAALISSSIVADSVGTLDLDLSMIIVPKTGRKRDIERAARRKKVRDGNAAAALLASSVTGVGGEVPSLSDVLTRE